MIGTGTIDPGREIDWGKTSRDYAKYRPGPPESFYKKLLSLDVGLENQKILDLGTGTGVLARQFAKQGCEVIGTDISDEQVNMADSLANDEGLNIDFFKSAAEDIHFPDNSFDVITANQCFLYFDKDKISKILKRILKPGGVFVTSHFSWMPFLDETAKASEELILKHNPSWTAHSYKGDIPPIHGGLEQYFDLKGFFYYDEAIPFTRETWKGRIRACRGVGASLSEEAVKQFDSEHDELLKEITFEDFTIIHRLDAHIMVSK
ncbi:MAG: class I SAM-dependent methyltransferase [Halobacteriovoraceae bacterium]|jgi:ubiquinone/menaquinone biosynthesis C-methylase UbiE|nr:class I SAM-dependent methyltransferase [Halobacteriovoraceae bacterium]